MLIQVTSQIGDAVHCVVSNIQCILIPSLVTPGNNNRQCQILMTGAAIAVTREEAERVVTLLNQTAAAVPQQTTGESWH